MAETMYEPIAKFLLPLSKTTIPGMHNSQEGPSDRSGKKVLSSEFDHVPYVLHISHNRSGNPTIPSYSHPSKSQARIRTQFILINHITSPIGYNFRKGVLKHGYARNHQNVPASHRSMESTPYQAIGDRQGISPSQYRGVL